MKRLEETAMILFRQSPCQVDTDDSLDFHKPSLHEELIQTSYIYEVNAVMKRYKYLLEQAAKNNLRPEETYSETYQALTLSN